MSIGTNSFRKHMVSGINIILVSEETFDAILTSEEMVSCLLPPHQQDIVKSKYSSSRGARRRPAIGEGEVEIRYANYLSKLVVVSHLVPLPQPIY